MVISAAPWWSMIELPAAEGSPVVPVTDTRPDIAWAAPIAASSAILGRATGLIAAALGTFVGVRFVLGGEAPSRAVALPLAALLVSLCVSGWLSLNYEGHVGLPATAIAA